MTGRRQGQLVQTSDARKIYQQTIDGEVWSAIQVTTAAGVCAVVDLHFAGQLLGGDARRSPVSCGRNRSSCPRLLGQSLWKILRPGLVDSLGRACTGCCRCQPCRLRSRHSSTALELPQPAAIAIGGRWQPGTGRRRWRSLADRWSGCWPSFRLPRPADVPAVVAASAEAFHAWRQVPAPRRGELVRQIGLALREQQASSWPSWSRWKPARSPAKPAAKSRR